MLHFEVYHSTLVPSPLKSQVHGTKMFVTVIALFMGILPSLHYNSHRRCLIPTQSFGLNATQISGVFVVSHPSQRGSCLQKCEFPSTLSH